MWKTISNLFIRLIEFQTDYTYIYTTYNLVIYDSIIDSYVNDVEGVDWNNNKPGDASFLDVAFGWPQATANKCGKSATKPRPLWRVSTFWWYCTVGLLNLWI